MIQDWVSWVAVSLLWLAPVTGASEEPTSPGIVFEEASSHSSGIHWVHENAMSPQRHLPETVGPGCAFFDYDNDGWMDLYLVNSGVSDFYTPATALRNALYRNDGDGTFTDVTGAAGVAGGRFGMGVAVADYDGDGWQDLYVTNYGPNYLYRNNGDGSFSEVAEDAGLLAPGWSTSGVWFDYNGDGRLDLFVCSFVHYDESLSKLCFDHLRKRTYYCLPTLFDPTASHLFRNDGNGRFTDVGRESGIAGHPGKAFGVVATDVNDDGHLDLFVANDTVADFLFVNQGDGTFREMGLWAGVAFDDGGKPRSGMGVDATDYDGDGRQDLFVSNIDHEVFSLYRNQGDLTFTDEAADVGKLTWLLSGCRNMVWHCGMLPAGKDGKL
ncbi:MAG: VCBS repeat-containing protein, partial [Candidatus Aminicenantes bacterium]|nr:VCBS repeat-containing protein [Candidatus Aminicenantes bacterium]